MVAAMMLPNLLPLLKLIKVRGDKAFPFVFGYFTIWLGFCMLGVAVTVVPPLVRYLKWTYGHYQPTDCSRYFMYCWRISVIATKISPFGRT